MTRTATPPVCRACGFPTLYSDRGWFCFPCQRLVSDDVEATNIQQVAEAIRDLRADPEAEPQVVEAIRKALEARGWLVYRIGQRNVKGAGSDAGVPDMMVVYPPRPPYGAKTVLLEVKTATGRLSKEQARLVAMGVSFCVRSVEDALRVCGYEEAE